MVGVAVEGPYSYRIPPGMAVTRGSIVAVPLGPRLTLGGVWGPPRDMVAHNRLRDIAQAYDLPPLSEELLKLVDWVARYTLAAPGQVLRAVLRSTEALDAPKPVVAFRRTGLPDGFRRIKAVVEAALNSPSRRGAGAAQAAAVTLASRAETTKVFSVLRLGVHGPGMRRVR